MKLTIYDVAKKAGVSISTVSKVINNQPVGMKSKQKVKEVIRELNYQPSVLASALTGKRTSTIGFLLPDIANPLVAEMARRVEDRAHEYGFNVLICSTDLDSEKEECYVSLLRRKSVDGFILAGGFRNRQVISELLQDNVPLILLSDTQPYSSINMVTVDNFVAGYEIASHLISLGHKRIAMIGEDNSSSTERINGYKKALDDNGIQTYESLIAICDSSIEHVKCLASSLLDSSNPPTAIISCNDKLAIGVLLVAREKGLKIPKDLSITGFDNTLLSECSDPPLTTVEVPIQSMCSQAVDLLMEDIQGNGKEKQKIMVLPKLIIRNSTAVPRN